MTTRDSDLQPLIVSSNELMLEIFPAIGGKIRSLVDRKTNTDWMWSPPDGRGLFRNKIMDGFPDSTLAGADECFPTVAACRWENRELPDHGELWAVPWDILLHRPDALELEVRAPISPFRFRRDVAVKGSSVHFSYSVENLGRHDEAFVWAFHPLFKYEAGDRLEIPASSARIDSQLNTPFGPRGAAIALPHPAPGIDLARMDFGDHAPAAVKYFTDRLETGRAALVRPALGRRLVFEFDRNQLDTLGVWINAKGWAGYQHVAIEPTNGAPDPLDIAAQWGRCRRLAPGASLTWAMTLRFEDAT